MLCESISEIGLIVQGHLQGQRSWSMSSKLTQALWLMPLKSAAVGFTKSKCWSFGLSLNGVVQIIFCNWIYYPKSDLKFKIMVEVQYTLSSDLAALSSNNAIEMLISAFVFGPQTDSLPSHPSWHSFDKHPLYAKVGDGYGDWVYLHVISHAAAYGGNADQVEGCVTLQECFPLTKWDAHQ